MHLSKGTQLNLHGSNVKLEGYFRTYCYAKMLLITDTTICRPVLAIEWVPVCSSPQSCHHPRRRGHPNVKRVHAGVGEATTAVPGRKHTTLSPQHSCLIFALLNSSPLSLSLLLTLHVVSLHYIFLLDYDIFFLPFFSPKAYMQPHLLGNEFTHLEFPRRVQRKEVGKRMLYRDFTMSGWWVSSAQSFFGHCFNRKYSWIFFFLPISLLSVSTYLLWKSQLYFITVMLWWRNETHRCVLKS